MTPPRFPPRLRGPVLALFVAVSALVAVGIWMVYCRSRTQETFRPRVESLTLGLSRTEIEELLTPVCEAIVDQPTWSRYRCRPLGEGLCACAPTMVLMVDLGFTPESLDGAQMVASIRRWDVGGFSQSAQE